MDVLANIDLCRKFFGGEIRLYVLWGQGCAESDYMSCGAISAGNQIISFVGPGVQGIRLYVQFVSVPIHVCWSFPKERFFLFKWKGEQPFTWRRTKKFRKAKTLCTKSKQKTTIYNLYKKRKCWSLQTTRTVIWKSIQDYTTAGWWKNKYGIIVGVNFLHIKHLFRIKIKCFNSIYLKHGSKSCPGQLLLISQGT